MNTLVTKIAPDFTAPAVLTSGEIVENFIHVFIEPVFLPPVQLDDFTLGYSPVNKPSPNRYWDDKLICFFLGTEPRYGLKGSSKSMQARSDNFCYID